MKKTEYAIQPKETAMKAIERETHGSDATTKDHVLEALLLRHLCLIFGQTILGRK